MQRPSLRTVLVPGVMLATWLACLGAARAGKPASAAAIGVDVAGLSPVVDHPFAPFSRIARAEWRGYDLDDDTKDTLETRVEMTVREAPEKIAGAMTTVAEFTHYEKGAVVERSWKYFAQDANGAVFILGERVDDVEDGKVVGHVGQWIAGEKRARAGLYMPATPVAGGIFEQGLAPGIAESRSKVTKLGATYNGPAGTFADCVETDVVDPVSKARSTRIYCRGQGRVSESSNAHSLQLVALELRTPPPQLDGK